ncbi:FHA domain-containing protein [uncultured Gimesia sp.]|uniref:FHA domain-containing protein n=1 Tax=uncultured Gimesia sp. TaxID=1678688 RepID=UPI0030D9EF8F
MGFFTSSSKDSQQAPAAKSAAGSSYLLWIDGVGTYLVYLQETMRIGGPGEPGTVGGLGSAWADLSLLANLSRHHASIVRSGESYYLEAKAPVFCNQRAVNDRVLLTDQAELRLNTDTVITFRQPTVLSATACLELTSHHQPQQRLDGIILMAETCLLGPSSENHVVCHNWPGTVILYRQGDQILCRSKLEIYANEESASEGAALTPGSLVSGPELRFRWEVVS